MNKIIIVLLALVVMFTAPVQADWNQNDEKMLNFNIGSTDAGVAASSNIFRVPMAGKISTIYMTDESGIATDPSDYVTITLYLNNVAYGHYHTSDGAFTAVVPKALTPTALVLAAGDILQIKVTKVGSGKATVNFGVTIAYHNGK